MSEIKEQMTEVDKVLSEISEILNGFKNLNDSINNNITEEDIKNFIELFTKANDYDEKIKNTIFYNKNEFLNKTNNIIDNNIIDNLKEKELFDIVLSQYKELFLKIIKALVPFFEKSIKKIKNSNLNNDNSGVLLEKIKILLNFLLFYENNFIEKVNSEMIKYSRNKSTTNKYREYYLQSDSVNKISKIIEILEEGTTKQIYTFNKKFLDIIENISNIFNVCKDFNTLSKSEEEYKKNKSISNSIKYSIKKVIFPKTEKLIEQYNLLTKKL